MIGKSEARASFHVRSAESANAAAQIPGAVEANARLAAAAKEERVVDPNTGGEKGSKLARFDLIPWDAIWGLAEHFGVGARKYEDRNWERGYRWGLSFAALHRHLAAWWNGEDNDPESGDSHLLAVAWHALCLWWFQKHGKGTDDRPKLETEEHRREREELAATRALVKEAVAGWAPPADPRRPEPCADWERCDLSECCWDAGCNVIGHHCSCTL